MSELEKGKSSVITLLRSIMQYGFVLGIFWFIKYIFFIIFDLWDHMWYVYNLLNIGTLLLYYVLVKRYRDNALGGKLGYLQCIIFSTLLFFFASLLESIIMYIHIGIINPNFVSQHGRGLSLQIAELFYQMFTSPTHTINVAKPFKLASNAEYIINNIYTSSLYGFFLSLIYGIFVRRKKLLKM
ncbi:hypothetical protein M2132_001352 [Dysgonomonas sp. PH5-45]|uniref:DUF4199 domain-containing protein n=1 Tax=unclassified Dysgonomonas TaxID=2630389 RepID=UPI002475004A|nr:MULTISPECIES: DUF4199 domain-containing protein [unclassified Dysgonomonas]MDH6355015.1 hypothetical protein [Dysgonomonas sp. PH5-45]MDH6387860.1 hypothetical protein [Dysgonomonas sp. PH5-37]